MTLRAPEFWRNDGWLSRGLLPLARAYATLGRRRRQATVPEDCGLPVLCVGNLVTGGVGKTPLALDLLARLEQRGVRAFALTRGYGGRSRGPLQVDPGRHGWRDVGDEALLLARQAPTIVARDRIAGARLARASGAQAIVMDDGFQNPALVKTLSLLAIDRRDGLGNGRVLPAGPLREPAAEAFARTDALVLVGEGLAGEREDVFPQNLPRLYGRIETLDGGRSWQGQRVLAFAGIGVPRKFFDGLRNLGAEIVSALSFPDHHAYRPSELALILSKAAELGALPVTTEKDIQRIEPLLAERITALPAAFFWQDEAPISALLDRVLTRR